MEKSTKAVKMENHKKETIVFYSSILGNLIYGFKYREPEIFSRLAKNGSNFEYEFTKTKIEEVEHNIYRVKEFADKNHRLPSKTELENILDNHGKEDI